MSVSKLPELTPKAAKFWSKIPIEIKQQLLANVYCFNCRDVVKIVDFKGTIQGGDLVLNGICEVCGHEVARLIEGTNT